MLLKEFARLKERWTPPKKISKITCTSGSPQSSALKKMKGIGGSVQKASPSTAHEDRMSSAQDMGDEFGLIMFLY